MAREASDAKSCLRHQELTQVPRVASHHIAYRRLGGVRPTVKSFRLIRACDARWQCLVKTLTSPFSVPGREKVVRGPSPGVPPEAPFGTLSEQSCTRAASVLFVFRSASPIGFVHAFLFKFGTAGQAKTATAAERGNKHTESQEHWKI